jgi:hypothetical protein
MRCEETYNIIINNQKSKIEKLKNWKMTGKNCFEAIFYESLFQVYIKNFQTYWMPAKICVSRQSNIQLSTQTWLWFMFAVYNTETQLKLLCWLLKWSVFNNN